jgi:hypothetical protein
MISLADQIKEAQRELALRKKLYPQWIKRGTLTEGQATYYLQAMEAIVQTLRQLDMDQRQLHLFREVARP